MSDAALTLARIAEHVAWEAGSPTADVIRSTRRPDVRLRRMAVWLMRQLGPYTFGEIGAAMGRDRRSAENTYFDATRLHARDVEFRRIVGIVAPCIEALS